MNKLLLSSILLIGILVSSCHSLVDDEFANFARVPVLNGLLQADSTFSVQVTFSANLTDSAPPPVGNAIVVIETANETPDTLTYTKEGWYVSPKIVRSGVNYTCKVSIPDFPDLSAQTIVPEPTTIDSVIFTDLAGRGEEGEKISTVDFYIANNPAQKQFWQVELVMEGLMTDYNVETREWEEYYGTMKESIYMLAGQDTVLLNEASPLTLFSNKLMTKNTYKVKFYINENYTHLGGSLTPYIVLRSVDESYYKYVKQYEIYESASWADIGKTSQKYPLYSNVTNGLGIFTGCSMARKEIELNFEGK